MNSAKPILDPCCGSRMWHYNKNNPFVLFNDIRTHSPERLSNGSILEIRPDTMQDYRELQFPNDSFYLIVFDPPHTTCGTKSFLYKKYGTLFPSWQSDLTAAFEQLFRVLKPGGTIIFKWCDIKIKFDDILALSPHPPVVTHKVKAKGESYTYFAVFYKP